MNQDKKLYTLFVGVFVLNVAVTVWNIAEGHKLRKLQQELAEKQLAQVKNKEKLNGTK